LFRTQKNQSKRTKEMNAIAPPTVPPTMAPKLGAVEGAVVGDGVLELVGVLVGRDELGGGVTLGVTESADTVGVLEANAPIPVSIGVGPIDGVVVTALAAEINEA